MRQFMLISVPWIFLCTFTGCASSPATNPSETTIIYISKDGNDNWSGLLAAPNSEQSDGPLATFAQAQKKVRTLLTQQPQDIIIYIRGGNYRITETVNFSALDSGTKEHPIIWSAYPEEEVKLLGGQAVSEYNQLSDTQAKSRISDSNHEHIIQIDLKKQGIDDYGSLKKTGFSRPIQPAALELFYRGKPMQLAEYPNADWLRIKDVPQFGDSLVHPGHDRLDNDGVPLGRHYGKFEYPGTRPSSWTTHEEIWVHGYWTHDWAESYERVARLDTLDSVIYTEAPHGVYGYTQTQPFRFVNVLEELDSPGEWYLDRQRGLLFFWPPGKILQGDLIVSLLEEPLMKLTDTRFLQIENMTFEATRAGGVEVEGGESNAFNGCIFRNIGNTGIAIGGGKLNGVRSCDISYTGGTGISIGGCDRLSLTPAGNFVRNSHIHHFARINRTYRPAVRLHGVGNILSHNYIHDAPHAGVLFSGNEHILEYNEVSHIARETGDVGAFYIGRNWTTRGNIIRFNYFHHLHGPGLHGVMGVYLDDAASGMTILGNVFYKAGRAAFIGGGHDNRVENNIFVECDPAVHLDARGLGWASHYIKRGGSWNMYEKLEDVNYLEPPYSSRYPELTNIPNMDNPAMPSGNNIVRNIAVNSNWIELDERVDLQLNTIEQNYTDYQPEHNNLAEQNFQLSVSAQPLRDGFQQIPFEKIGLYIDEYRKELP